MVALAASATPSASDPKRFVVAVAVLVVLSWLLARRAGPLRSWFGRLPGDLRFERGGMTFYLPLATGLLVSVLLSVLVPVGAWLLPRLGWLVGWIGRLPGDLRFEANGLTVYLPLASGLVLSVLVSVVVAAARGGRRRGPDDR